MRSWNFRAFSVPRGPSSPEENEDAYRVDQLSSAHFFALADGASQSIGADAWARLLVRASAGFPWLAVGETAEDHESQRKALLEGVEAWLSPLRAIWFRFERRRLGKRINHWSVHNKFLDGAYATFLTVNLELLEAGGARWRALAVGDACFFIVQSGTLVVRFPLQEAGAFNSRPVMLGTRTIGVQAWRESLQVRCGEAAPGSWVFAMTDAMGKWFLTRFAEGARPWEQLLGFRTEEDFTRWVLEARERLELESDDTTIVFGQV